jgi:CBS domain containing-hemolysin-like protein
LNGSGWILLRALGISQEGHRHLHSPEEIQYLVAESRKGGLLAPEEQRRLQHALSMGVRRVRQLMVPRTEMKALRVDATVAEAHEITRALPYTRYPVYRGTIDGIIGYVHARDLALARLQGRSGEALESLSRPILGVPEELSADRLLARLRETRAVMSLVVDEYGGVAGLVTIHDLLTELLGDVADEPWPDEPAPVRLPGGAVRLPGRMTVHDAEEWTDLRWDGDADTVNGIVTDILGRLPVVGDTVIVDGGTVMVESVDGVVAAWVLVTLPDAGSDDS